MAEPITPEFIDEVLACVGAGGACAHEALALQLRARFPRCHISVCSEDDVSPRLSPAAENEACAIYYVAAGDHCFSLTNDVAAATGIVVALRDQED